MLDEAARKELVRLVELDYDRTSKFIESMVGISGSVRTLAITVWVAVVGVAAAQRIWPLGLVAAALVAAFAIVDGYHAWRYEEAPGHAQGLERVTSAYYGAQARGADDPSEPSHLPALTRLPRSGL